MGIYISALNFNEKFHQLRTPPIIINDVMDYSIEEKQKLNDIIFTTYSNDLMSNIPTCECGSVTGQYNLGIVCENCNTLVSENQGDLESFVWMRVPNGLKALINPTVWIMICEHFTKDNFNIIAWLADRNYKSDYKTPDIITIIEGYGFKRGLNYFVENFDTIMAALFQLKPSEYLESFLRIYRDCIFSQYIPLPNKMLLVVEENNAGIFVDKIVTDGIDAIRTLVGIDSPLTNYSVQVKENRTIKCIDKLAEFYLNYYKTTFAQKEGIFRKHIFGSRSHFSFRTVISSITEPHHYEDIYIPWAVGVNVLKIHLTNKLLKQGMTPNEINGFLFEHTTKYHPRLDQLFQELIAESPNGEGIPCVFVRNPSLQRGSAQRFKITRVKTDVAIHTTSLSILAVRALNADFDGDACSVMLGVDNYINNGLKNLAPHKNTFDFDSYRSVSSNLLMPKPVISVIASWLDDDN